MNRTGRSSVLIAALMFGARAIASAQVIPITNGSFETPGPTEGNVAGPFSDDAITGWVGTSGSVNSFGTWRANTDPFPGGLPDGAQVAYINAGSIYQDVTATLTADTTYTLTGYYGYRRDLPISHGSFNLTTTGDVLLATTGSVTAPVGEFQFYSLSFTPLDTDPHLGQALRVVLTMVGEQADFDLITLTAAPASANPATPEPGASSSLLAAGSASIGLVLRRRFRRN